MKLGNFILISKCRSKNQISHYSVEDGKEGEWKRSKRKKKDSAKGYNYCLSSHSYTSDIYKILSALSFLYIYKRWIVQLNS